MKKGFFWLFYLLFLTFFDIVLVIIRFNNSIYDFLISLNIKNEWILGKLFLLVEVIFIIICLTFAYLISKIKVSKKSLLIPPLVMVAIKVIIFFCIFVFLSWVLNQKMQEQEDFFYILYSSALELIWEW